MQRSIHTRFGVALCALAGLAGRSLGDVLYVDGSGNGNHLAIQPAIDAASDGDVILVRTGTYAGFTIDMRRLFIVEDAGATAKVAGTIRITNSLPNGLVLIAGLDVTAKNGVNPSASALVVDNCAGHVRVQDCLLRGGEGASSFPTGKAGGLGADIKNSARVVFASTSIHGGTGYGFVVYGPHGGPGGDGISTYGSAVALYDCTIVGGTGGDADYVVNTHAGRGGDGAHVYDFGILASGCSFTGGFGGSTSMTPGAGGDGLVVDAAQAQLIGNTLAGGQGGWGYSGNFGPPGQPQSGAGVFNFIPGTRRRFHTGVLAAESGSVQIDVAGDPGDQVWVISAVKPGYTYMPSLAGIATIPFPVFMTLLPLGTLPASGSATFPVRTVTLAGALDAQRGFMQGFSVSSAGVARLGSPLHMVSLNCSALVPDCNSNGQSDSCDILRTVSGDCDSNGVPDDCQPDCNGNGLADPCDIAAGTSKDLNHNLVPDECEPQTTWHVDANASPGGNGSAGAPFQALGSAFSVAISGDTVLVANGVYQGAANRNLDFGSRDLVVQSTGGAASCIIDCQLLGRAFNIQQGITAATRIEGFTIRNGKQAAANFAGGGMYVFKSNPVVRFCIFEGCEAHSVGGAIGMELSSVFIQGCTFTGNKSISGYGGALWVSNGANTAIVDCSFVGNQGGALRLGSTTARIERCLFLSNTSADEGGAISASSCQMFLDQSVLAGNAAVRGGALSDGMSNWRVNDCTIVDNRATQRAGAAVFEYGPLAGATRVFRNTIVWNNTSPPGTQFDLDYGPLDVAYCDVQGGQAGIAVLPQGNLMWGAGNLDLDPAFVDADGPDNNPMTVADNDYRLSLSSPCLDAGDNTAVPADVFDLDGDGNVTEPLPLDFDGLPRFVEIPSAPNTGVGPPPIVDLGAWERQP